MLKVIGLNHNTAPVEVREHFAFDAEQGARFLTELARGRETEAVLLSTCNRTEIYLGQPESDSAERVVQLLAEHAHISPTDVNGYLYSFDERSGVDHLFRVVSSLYSMILGEPQIQGQVKTAYERAVAAGSNGTRVVGPLLSRLFQVSIYTGKRARSETHISLNPTSVSSLAASLCEKIVPDLAQAQILVLGAGEMAELAVGALRKRGATRLVDVATLTGAVVRVSKVPEAFSCAKVRIVISGTTRRLMTVRFMSTYRIICSMTFTGPPPIPGPCMLCRTP